MGVEKNEEKKENLNENLKEIRENLDKLKSEIKGGENLEKEDKGKMVKNDGFITEILNWLKK